MAVFADAQYGIRPSGLLEASNAKTVERLLWDEKTGRPYLVGQAPQLSVFGARKSRTDADTQGDPYYPYVHLFVPSCSAAFWRTWTCVRPTPC